MPKAIGLRTSNFAGTFTGFIRKKPIENFGEQEAWAYSGTAQFWVPLLYQDCGWVKLYELQILYAHS